jgi:predicted dehydrogenase
VAERIRIGIVGCGDVADRRYVPGLATRASDVTIAAVADPRPGAAHALAASVARWSPGTTAHATVDEMVSAERLDGIVNLTPAPAHAAVNRTILDAGVACYSEKPLASSVDEATALIELASAREVLLLCAPGSAVTTRVRWLRDLADSGRLGHPTLAVAHHADPGPAAWREYTGDPTPIYGEGVGPVFDHGVYRLHEMTTVLGPVRRVQAMGTISIPRRRVRGGPLTGRTIEVTTPDHVLINLEFASGALGQLLASFGTPETLAPWLELHLTGGTVSFGGKSWEPDAPVSIYTDDDSDAAGEAWAIDVDVPRDELGVVELGARHFVACLLGEEEPVLTAEHARHVLDVILAAYASIADGRSHEVETTFAWTGPPLGGPSRVRSTSG